LNLNPFTKPKEDELEQARQASAINAVTPFMNQQNASDTQIDRELGVDKLLLEDEDLIKFIEKLCREEQIVGYNTVYIPLQNGDGSTMMQQEAQLDETTRQPITIDGKPVIVQKPVLMAKRVPITQIMERPWAYALRAYLSHIFSGRSIDAYDVDTYKLQVRCDFADLIDSMPYADYRDFSKFVEVLERAVETAFDDTKSDGRIGRKAGLLKVKRGELSVGMSKGPPNPGANKQ
jgi:glutaredoxin-related protein